MRKNYLFKQSYWAQLNQIIMGFPLNQFMQELYLFDPNSRVMHCIKQSINRFKRFMHFCSVSSKNARRP